MHETEIAVKQALAFVLDFDDMTYIKTTHSLKKDLALNSMSAVMFLIKLEESIEGFVVDPETLQPSDLETVGSMVNYVHWQLYEEGIFPRAVH